MVVFYSLVHPEMKVTNKAVYLTEYNIHILLIRFKPRLYEDIEQYPAALNVYYSIEKSVVHLYDSDFKLNNPILSKKGVIPSYALYTCS